MQNTDNQTSVANAKPFGRIRGLIWPIYSFELKKLVPMFVLFFLISFVYNMLRCLKVSLMVKAQGSGVEVIPFLKIGAVLPGALLLTYIYTLLMSRFNREQVFYIIISGFMAYFAFFLLVLYPNNHLLQLDTFADFLHSNFFTGAGSKGLISAVRHLNLTVFYVLCEMWSSVVLLMLFWGFANEVTTVEEAKRFYAIFALGANFSGLISGEFAQRVEGLGFIPVLDFYRGNEWIFFQICSVLLIGMVIIYLFWWLNRNVFRAEPSQSVSYKKSQEPKEKLSLRECFAYLRRSKYLAYMVVIVVGYNVVYNFSDVMWTYQVGLVAKTGKEVNTYMNQITSSTSIVAVTLALLISGNVIRKFGWTVAALITPVVWFITSIGFYSGLVFEGTAFFDMLSAFTANPANLVLLLGSIQICLGRGCKYTVFDEAKEIAFIPLPKNNQRKGKAIVDGLASRFGKSGGSMIYLCLFYLFGEMANVIPYISIIIFFVLIAWLYATIKMGFIVDEAIRTGTSLTLEEELVLGAGKPSVPASQTAEVSVERA